MTQLPTFCKIWNPLALRQYILVSFAKFFVQSLGRHRTLIEVRLSAQIRESFGCLVRSIAIIEKHPKSGQPIVERLT